MTLSLLFENWIKKTVGRKNLVNIHNLHMLPPFINVHERCHQIYQEGETISHTKKLSSPKCSILSSTFKAFKVARYLITCLCFFIDPTILSYSPSCNCLCICQTSGLSDKYKWSPGHEQSLSKFEIWGTNWKRAEHMDWPLDTHSDAGTLLQRLGKINEIGMEIRLSDL